VGSSWRQQTHHTPQRQEQNETQETLVTGTFMSIKGDNKYLGQNLDNDIFKI